MDNLNWCIVRYHFAVPASTTTTAAGGVCDSVTDGADTARSWSEPGGVDAARSQPTTCSSSVHQRSACVGSTAWCYHITGKFIIHSTEINHL